MILFSALAATAASAQTPPSADPAPPPDVFVRGDPGVTAIVCEVEAVHADPRHAEGATAGTAAPPRTVRVADPWGEAVLTGAGAPVPVTLFDRERTLIFDARREFLYLDRQSHRFSYTLFGDDGVTIWRGVCRAEG